MASYIPTSLVSIAIVFSALLVWLYGTTAYVKRQDFNNWNTESKGLIIPRDTDFDIVILGTSHARMFSRFENHLRIEKLLSSKIFNLSRTGGAGVVPMLMDLNWFFDLGNHAKVIVYFIDPWVLYSSVWNEDNFLANPCFFKEEPFSLDYAARIYKHGGQKACEKYFHERLKIEWLQYSPESRSINDGQLARNDSTRVKRRLAALYGESVNERNFLKYSSRLEEIPKLAAVNGTKLVFIIPPTLLGKEPGHDRTVALLKTLNSKYAVPFFDFSQSIEDPKLFQDQDHLNTEGVKVLFRNYLKPALAVSCATDSGNSASCNGVSKSATP